MITTSVQPTIYHKSIHNLSCIYRKSIISKLWPEGIPFRVNRIYCIIDTAPIIGATAISQGAMSTIAGCA
ncbi:hypothetical protein NP493_131g02030 [Ridgeia piscesae]|uniref:Uncharacterized protein n=1 Tax=Ridgeia piscesae TaxID=27915 RepID=A0AAD9P5D9_RIDPI|nr:hypothetical protein NP493_131g02030 [Ridgeia piscesae]